MVHARLMVLVGAALFIGAVYVSEARCQQAFNGNWGQTYSTQDWNRFYHYPYVFYPQNFWGSDYFRSSDDMYHRYPPEMQIPVYNRGWYNEYPTPRRYHKGHEFILDIF